MNRLMSIRICLSNAAMLSVATAALSGALADEPPQEVATDSTFPGYQPAVLTDGRFLNDAAMTNYAGPLGSSDAPGNGGNTWASHNARSQHHIRLAWPKPADVRGVTIVWSIEKWRPTRFKVQALNAVGEWVDAAATAPWARATAWRSLVPCETNTLAVRIVQRPFQITNSSS